VESNETKSNNKSKNPMKKKAKNKTLTSVSCSYKTRFCRLMVVALESNRRLPFQGLLLITLESADMAEEIGS
jgi:hypothetical protein